MKCETCSKPATKNWDGKHFCEPCAWDYWKGCHNNPEVFVFEPTASEMEAIEDEILRLSGAKSKHNKKYQDMLARYLLERETRIRKGDFDE